MHTIQLNIDDSILDKLIDLLDTLPQDKLEIIVNEKFSGVSLEKTKQAGDTSSSGCDINKLLREHDLSHFKFYEHENRIVYTYDTGTPQQKHDFTKLKALLKENKIKHSDIGLDVIMIR